MITGMKLSKTYEPGSYEGDIYALWEKSGAFKPADSGKSYSIVMPPPNANANLHIGYGLTAALEDIAARYHRLKGEAVLLLPGADHAGFETQSVYEKHLAKEGKSRFDFSREELYQQIWDFVALNKDSFEAQMRQMGVSCDWEHFTFTLDPKIVRRAHETFKKMWNEGLIYRSERLVNYCTYHRTGFADVEVVHRDAKTPLYYLKYGPFELATTRPETKFGDTAVAVHPDDERYKQYIGRVITVEGVNGPFDIQVIADDMVDPAFGSGVVKITPAHSFDDWEVAQRHNLPAKRVINHDGRLNHLTGRFEGLTVMEAREAVAQALEEKGLLVKVDRDYTNRMGYCYKCGTVIEPMLMEQWFINMEPLAKRAVKALEAGQITFHPESKKDQLINYLKGLRDWNISRQIAWGIPIPAFQNVNDGDDWIYDDRVDQEIIEVDGKTYHRDPDVFDTWFSSSSWPYATLDFPDSDDFKRFYPLSLMETGGEILYPWVSRMIMLGLYNTGEIPFKEVYIHGYVMAADGSKMSKSIGNAVDPIPVIEQYGSDALRMGIISGRAPAVNRGYDQRRVEEARNFCNKLWNIARYVETAVNNDPSRHQMSGPSLQVSGVKPASAADHWILSKLQQSQEKLCSELDSYRFSEAYDTLYHFVWDDVADWYIEASKAAPNKDLLAYLLEAVITLAHPFAPFVTETIWQTLATEKDSLLATRRLMKVPGFDTKRAGEFSDLQAIVSEARYILGALKASGVTLYYTDVPFLRDNAETIKRLAHLYAVSEVKDGNGLYLTGTKHKCWLDIDKATARAYAKELEGKVAQQEQIITQLEGRLANTDYVSNAPKEIVEQTKEQLKAAQEALESLTGEIKRFA